MLAGCGGGDYELQIQFETPGLAGLASVVYVWLVDVCPLDTEWHVPPLQALESSVVRRGQPVAPLGETSEGRYAVHALARDDSCAAFAAGCEEVRLRSGDDGTIRVTLSETIANPQCEVDEVCDQGQCWPQGSCAPIGSNCRDRQPCCTGSCAPDTQQCEEVPAE
jgi:hypothetical protein